MGKASRRKREHRGAERLLEDFWREAFKAEHKRAGEILASGPTMGSILEVGRAACEFADFTIGQVKQEFEPASPIACRPGCAECCLVEVLATAPEVFYVATDLQTRPLPLDLSTVRQRVTAVAEKTIHLNAQQRADAKVACPLLDDSRCIAYPARPLTCRGMNSVTPGGCRGDDTMIFGPQKRIADGLLAGLSAALVEAELDGNVYELAIALSIALETPDAIAKWLAGEPLFAPALRGFARAAI